ncbi:MAG: transcriptional regulator NrdR [Pirellulales bacterium]|jgi:transcriptional repressor NrdR|nr:transcriptional regulator NrdR [Pirellulales bacterium]
MKCPNCNQDNDRVIDSRSLNDGTVIRRRRECNLCHRRYTTYERREVGIYVVKKDGTREPYSAQKLKTGLAKACWKRPISDDQLEALVAQIESEVEANFSQEVPSHHLGELAMHFLRDLDQVAYVRFASVYREFKDARDFVGTLEPMLRKSPPEPHS